MRKFIALLAVSALAVTSPALQAKPDSGGGNPGGGGGPKGGGNPHQGGSAGVQQQQSGGGNQDRGGGAPRGNGPQAGGERGQGQARQVQAGGGPERQQRPSVQQGGGRPERGPARQAERQGGGDAHGQARHVQRGHGPTARERGPAIYSGGGERGHGNGKGNISQSDKGNLNRANAQPVTAARFDNRGGGRAAANRDYGPARQWMRYRDARNFAAVTGVGVASPLILGCPPGLAAKDNGCMPPGQARKIWGYADPYENWYTYPVWYDYDPRYDWRYNGGYLYRVDPATLLITAFLPLLGGALYDGEYWPASYTDYAVDPYYDRYYGYGDGYDYRYADGAIFAVEPSGRIDNIVALLTGDDWVVGERWPNGYDFYNVPPAYRDRYYDSDEAWYRYSDGYVYEIDPTTLLVRRIIELLINS